MRERSQKTPRRRGPKMPLPRRSYTENRGEDVSESPYYTIDNTEDIYGTKILPSQRCYVDPWDLENYDYVRKKLEKSKSPSGYEPSLSPSPPRDSPPSPKYYYNREPQLEAEYGEAMVASIPRNRYPSRVECDLECCMQRSLPRNQYESLYGVKKVSSNKYDDYLSNMMTNLQLVADDEMERSLYFGYGDFSSSSSTEHHSSIGEERLYMITPGTERLTRTRGGGGGGGGGGKLSKKPTSAVGYGTLPLMPCPYEYCNPYATLPLPCCSFPDCYECQKNSSLLYATQPQSSFYGTGTMSMSMYGGSISYGADMINTLSRRPSSTFPLYEGIYNNKFGMNKKGLLQIDYSCSWNDLGRFMGRN